MSPLLAGCDDPGCVILAVEVPSVDVEIRDASTGQPIAATARGSVHRASSVIDFLSPGRSDGGVLLSRHSRQLATGEYTVQVQHPGYQPWQQDQVPVNGDRCSARTVSLRGVGAGALMRPRLTHAYS